MANITKLTAKKKEAFLELIRSTANISKACRAMNVSRFAVYEHKKNDEEFSKAWDEAYEEAVDSLEQEARRRAVEGTDEPVFYQGEVVGHIRRYSDTLLIFLLKGARPEKYRENIHQEISAPNGEPIRIEADYRVILAALAPAAVTTRPVEHIESSREDESPRNGEAMG